MVFKRTNKEFIDINDAVCECRIRDFNRKDKSKKQRRSIFSQKDKPKKTNKLAFQDLR